MKIFFSFILFVCLTLTAFAQSAVTFPDSNAIWVTGHYVWDSGHINYNYSTTNYCMDTEDTTIGSYTYSKINYCGGAYKGASRMQAGKVYYIPKDSTQDYLLYDFSAQVGDLLYNVYYELGDEGHIYGDPLTVNGISEVVINGIAHKQIELYGPTWIEGIGNTNGLFAGIETLESFYYSKLDCMSQNDTTLYPEFSLQTCQLTLSISHAQKNDDLLVFPNPTQHSFTLQWNESWNNASMQVYNSSGHPIHPAILYTSDKKVEVDLSNYPEGLYSIIVNAATKNYTAKIIKQ